MIANVLQIPYNDYKGGVDMAQTMVDFRMDETLKKNMEKICKEMGLTVSAAYTMFATKVTKEQRIPFEISVDPFYNADNIARLRKNAAEMEKTGGTIHEVNLDD